MKIGFQFLLLFTSLWAFFVKSRFLRFRQKSSQSDVNSSKNGTSMLNFFLTFRSFFYKSINFHSILEASLSHLLLTLDVLGGIWGGLGRSWVGLESPGPRLIEKLDSLALRWPSLAPHLGPPNRPKSIKNRCQDACKFCISFRIDFIANLDRFGLQNGRTFC